MKIESHRLSFIHRLISSNTSLITIISAILIHDALIDFNNDFIYLYVFAILYKIFLQFLSICFLQLSLINNKYMKNQNPFHLDYNGLEVFFGRY